MKGYVYITGDRADPGAGNILTDPVFKKNVSLGACMPNIRRLVVKGDWIFAVSSKVQSVQQYVVGGFQVAEKISTLTAYRRFPENRLTTRADGEIVGNIIVDSRGNQHPLDHHPKDTFEDRVKNFVVGTSPVSLETPREVELGRAQTLSKLSQLLGKRGNRVVDVMARWSKLDEAQVHELVDWLRGIKALAARP